MPSFAASTPEVILHLYVPPRSILTRAYPQASCPCPLAPSRFSLTDSPLPWTRAACVPTIAWRICWLHSRPPPPTIRVGSTSPSVRTHYSRRSAVAKAKK
eukprot:101910-Pleurochrysis_carterae.AAC.2